MSAYRIAIVDDHPLYREALRAALSGCAARATVLEAASLDELTGHLDAGTSVDVVLFAVAIPGRQGLSALTHLRARYPNIPLIAVSAKEDHATMRCCLDIGAAGFITKSLTAESIREAVKSVLAGEKWLPPGLDQMDAEAHDVIALGVKIATLTPQQVRVLTMLSEGLLNKQIAYQLGVSEATVKAHVSAILQKLDVDSRTQAVIAVNRLDSHDWQNAAP